jgi:hypothetical protein
MSALTCSFYVLTLLSPAAWSAVAAGSPAKPSTPNFSADQNDSAPREDGKKQAPRKKLIGKFTISKETTYVTGPLGKDGKIDYVAALNDRLRQGVTPANNANVLLWMALGPHPERAGTPAEFFEWLGIPAPPEQGDYFIDLSRYIKDNLRIEPGEAADAIKRQLDRSVQQPWSAQQHPHLASWLKANGKPLALVVEATKRSHYFSPLVLAKTENNWSSLLNAVFSGVPMNRKLANALAARAMLRAGEGATDDAWQDLLACHRLGLLVGRGGTLIEGLVGVSIDNVASKADLAFLDRAKLTDRGIESCLRDLQKLPPVPDMANKLELGERFVFLETTQMLARGGIQDLQSLLGITGTKECMPTAERIPEGINWDVTLRMGNGWYDRMAAAMREKDFTSRKRKFEQIDRDLKASKKKFEDAKQELEAILRDDKQTAAAANKAAGDIVGEAIGVVLMGMFIPAGDKVQQAADRARQVQDNVCVAFALARYKRDHGGYPKELNALAPRYLQRVPLDLFSDKAIIYRVTENGYLLYSAGANGKDEGGRGYGEEPPGDDLSVRMPLPELRL